MVETLEVVRVGIFCDGGSSGQDKGVVSPLGGVRGAGVWGASVRGVGVRWEEGTWFVQGEGREELLWGE